MGIPEIVAEEIAKQKQAALDQLKAEHDKAQAQITENENALATKTTELVNDFVGFRTGLRPAAFMTANANALSFDPLQGVESTAPPDTSYKIPIGVYAVAGFLLWVAFRKGKK